MTAPIRAFISGCSGFSLTNEETDFFRKNNPWGLIVFKRNVQSTEQLIALTSDFRSCVGRKDAPVLVDQEGGRVQRLSPASGDWRQYPSARAFSQLYTTDPALALRAIRHSGRLMAEDMFAAGLTVDCLPVLDLPIPGMTDAIGSRTYATSIETIIALAQAHVSGLIAGGILPVMKHIPGHGRATVDSHLHLPVVDATLDELKRTDFVPFAAMAHLPMGMTGHIVFSKIDKQRPATQSRKIIKQIIRDQIAFQGLLMTDDLSMQALSGSITERAEASFTAGCDLVLHCNGVMEEMQAVAAVAKPLKGISMRRARAALKQRRKPEKFDRKLALADIEQVMATTA